MPEILFPWFGMRNGMRTESMACVRIHCPDSQVDIEIIGVKLGETEGKPALTSPYSKLLDALF